MQRFIHSSLDFKLFLVIGHANLGKTYLSFVAASFFWWYCRWHFDCLRCVKLFINLFRYLDILHIVFIDCSFFSGRFDSQQLIIHRSLTKQKKYNSNHVHMHFWLHSCESFLKVYISLNRTVMFDNNNVLTTLMWVC